MTTNNIVKKLLSELASPTPIIPPFTTDTFINPKIALNTARIIVANKDFYLGVLTKDAPAAQEVLKGIIGEADTSDIYEVIKRKIDELIIKEEEGDSSGKE